MRISINSLCTFFHIRNKKWKPKSKMLIIIGFWSHFGVYIPRRNGENSSNVGLFWSFLEAKIENVNYNWVLKPLWCLYTPKKWWKFEQCRSLLIIFGGYVTDNTTQSSYCGGYRLGRVLQTSLSYWFDLRTTSRLYTLKKLRRFKQFRLKFKTKFRF